MHALRPLFLAAIATILLAVVFLVKGRPAQADDRTGPAKPNAVLIGWETQTRSILTQPPDFSYHSVRLSSLSFGATHNISSRASNSIEYADAEYFDVRTSSAKTVSGSGFFSQEGDEDFENVKQRFVIGLGLQRRIVARTASAFRPYAGLGAGIYYLIGTVRFYGTDYHSIPQGEASSRQNTIPYTYNSESSDHAVTVGGKLFLGVEHQSGLFLQGDLTFLPDLSTTTNNTAVKIPETAIAVRAGYRF